MEKSSQGGTDLNTYKEILKEIELHEHLLDSAEINYKYYNDILNNRNPLDIKAICYSDDIKGSKPDMDLVQAIDYAHKWSSMVDIENNIIKTLEKQKIKIDECVNSLEDATVKVSMLRAMGLTQEQVGELVGISDRHVRRLENKMS